MGRSRGETSSSRGGVGVELGWGEVGVGPLAVGEGWG